MAEDEDVNIIIKAEKQKSEIGIPEQNPYNRKKEKREKKEIPPFTTEHHMKNVNKNAGLDENDNYIHRRMQDQEYTNKEKMKNKNNPEKEGLHTGISYSKYAVGGESKEVPASPLDENDNFIHRRQLNQPKQRKIRKNKYH
jgi:hypothetical protein